MTSERYPLDEPQVRNVLCVDEREGQWQVAIRDDTASQGGAVIATAPTRDLAIAIAVERLEHAVDILQLPPAAFAIDESAPFGDAEWDRLRQVLTERFVRHRP
jgi:hypothetical protein